MSGKQAKREKRLEKDRQRQAQRAAERRKTISTLIIIAIVVGIGGVLIAISLEDPSDVAEQPTPSPSASASASEDSRPIACGGSAPATLGAPKPTYTAAPGEEVLSEGVDYHAVVDTTCGTVKLDLAEDRAPLTVANFVFLAQTGFFDGLEIFRNATSIGALQTGSGTNDASYNIGYTITDEVELAEAEGYPPGSVAMANTGAPNSGGSQFFFVYNDKFRLDPTYTRFAMATEGLEVLEQIGAIPAEGPQGETPAERAFMNTVTIVDAAGNPVPPTEAVETAAPAAPGGPTDAVTDAATSASPESSGEASPAEAASPDPSPTSS